MSPKIAGQEKEKEKKVAIVRRKEKKLEIIKINGCTLNFFVDFFGDFFGF